MPPVSHINGTRYGVSMSSFSFFSKFVPVGVLKMRPGYGPVLSNMG